MPSRHSTETRIEGSKKLFMAGPRALSMSPSSDLLLFIAKDQGPLGPSREDETLGPFTSRAKIREHRGI